jgi:hypothetical protein
MHRQNSTADTTQMVYKDTHMPYSIREWNPFSDPSVEQTSQVCREGKGHPDVPYSDE